MDQSEENPLRRRADWVDVRGWGLIAAVLGSLVGVPLWSAVVLGEREHLWMLAIMMLVGIAGAVALWRYLSQPVHPGQEDDLIPAVREARLREERRQSSGSD